MQLVEATANRLLGDDEGDRVLETGMVVTYARAFVNGNRGGGVRDINGPWHRDEDNEQHRALLILRGGYHAHADRTPLRTLVDTAAMLGLDHGPIFSERMSALNDDSLMPTAALARRQAGRFKEVADELAGELGEEPPGVEKWTVGE